MKKRCLLNRRAYFFVIDSIISLGVLAVGTFLIFTLYINAQPKEGPAILSEDLMDSLTNNKIKNIDNPYAGLGGILWQQGKITNAENSLLQQVAEFYKGYDLNKDTNPAIAEEYLGIIEKFTINLTKNILPPQYSFELWIHDSTSGAKISKLVYPKNPSLEHLDSKGATEVLIPSRKIVYGILDKESGSMFGPYDAEVLVWQ